MPGRGRGSFGTKFSFDLAALGFGGKFGLSQLTSAQAPPSAFPPLDAAPAKLIENNEHEYLVELNRNFHSLVNDSPFYLRPLKAPKPFIERYSDLVASQAEREKTKELKAKHKGKLVWPPVDQWAVDWERFPVELRPLQRKSPTTSASTSKQTRKSKSVDDEPPIGTPMKKRLRVKDDVDDATIEKRLSALEKMEQSGTSNQLLTNIKQELVEVAEAAEEVSDEDNPAKKTNNGDDVEDEDEPEEGDQNAEEDFEEELGDYGEDYFDNGEAYEDDDDGDNEGPTY